MTPSANAGLKSFSRDLEIYPWHFFYDLKAISSHIVSLFVSPHYKIISITYHHHPPTDWTTFSVFLRAVGRKFIFLLDKWIRLSFWRFRISSKFPISLLRGFFSQLKKNFISPITRKLRTDDLKFNIRTPEKHLLSVEHKILKPNKKTGVK